MKKQPYQKQPGDFEIRVLKDSRIVLVGPDQELMDLAQSLCQKPQDQKTNVPHTENPEDTEKNHDNNTSTPSTISARDKQERITHGSTPDATQAAGQTE